MESVRPIRNHGLTAQEIKEGVRRIKDMLDVDVQNHFDWSASEEEEGHVDEKTINLWFTSIVGECTL